MPVEAMIPGLYHDSRSCGSAPTCRQMSSTTAASSSRGTAPGTMTYPSFSIWVRRLDLVVAMAFSYFTRNKALLPHGRLRIEWELARRRIPTRFNLPFHVSRSATSNDTNHGRPEEAPRESLAASQRCSWQYSTPGSRLIGAFPVASLLSAPCPRTSRRSLTCLVGTTRHARVLQLVQLDDL